MKNITYIYFMFFTFALATAINKCPKDSTLWCSSYEIAESCDVLQQCTKYVWKNENNLNRDYSIVNLTLYYETLCPDSKAFIISQLWNAFQNVSSIMNLTLVPYGNAKETWRNETKLWQYSCQHGSDECMGNQIQTCLIYYRPKVEDHFPFIFCMESNNKDDTTTAAQQCGQQLGIQVDKILNCAKTRLGNTLEHGMAVKTEILQPAHTYVPWVTLNGNHTEEIQQEAQTNLIQLICNTYTGTNFPDACKKNKII